MCTCNNEHLTRELLVYEFLFTNCFLCGLVKVVEKNIVKFCVHMQEQITPVKENLSRKTCSSVRGLRQKYCGSLLI